MIFRAKDGVRGKLIDLDTGKEIPKVIWFNDADGTFEAFRVDQSGEVARAPDGAPLVWWGRGNLKFVQLLAARAVQAGALQSPKQKILPPARKRQKHEHLRLPLLDADCQHYACLRPAEYAVSDEVELPPLLARGKRWARAKTVAVRYYCAFHYVPPRVLDDKGEVVSVWEEAGGVRPQ